ncbi:MAG: efflux RND transporter periplasmic adaptor subunit [Gammaproteobacteria bacterium]|jgi:membrane fusion protein (multidrug efflux system)
MPSMITQRKFALATALLGAALVLAACSGKEAGGRDGGQRSGPGGAGGPPPATVITSKVERRPFGPVIEAVGTALARESVEITSKSANTVTTIRFAEGQRVAAGAILVELDRAQVAAALAEAEANLVEARNQFNRGRDLSVTSALSKAQLDQLETAVKTGESRVAAARARLDDTVIRAPFAGRTGFRKVSRGGLVSPGTIITTLDDSSVIKLEFTVPQSFLNDLAPGLAVEARAEGLGGRVFNGKITTIDSRIDPVTRAIAVRAELPNADAALRPGLFMSVRLRGKPIETLMIPEEALVPEEGRSFVFVVEDGKALQREVRTGGREPGSVAIIDGLTGNETVIVEGTQRTRNGGKVNAQPRTAAPGA